MATFTEAAIRARAQATTVRVRKSAKAVLEEASVCPPTEFDVFLSYSSQKPNEVILGVKETLKDYGLTAYVDKFDDPYLTPDNVTKGDRRDTPETASTIEVPSLFAQREL